MFEDPKVVLMGLSLVISIAALWVALRNTQTSKRSLEHSLTSSELEYTNLILVNLSNEGKDGLSLKTDLQITNHGEKAITVTRVWLSGKASTNKMDNFGVLYDSKSSYKPLPIKGHSSIKMAPRFIINNGEIKKLSLVANIDLLSSKNESISIYVPVEITIT